MAEVPVARVEPAAAGQVSLRADQLPGAVVAVDRSHQILHWNAGAEQLFGWSAAEALGRRVQGLLLPEHGPLSQVPATMAPGQPWCGELELRCRDGRLRPVYVAHAPLRDERGGVVGVVGVLQDLSGHREAIGAREALLDQARRRAERLADRNAALVELSSALASALTAEQVVEVVLGQVVAALGVDAGGVALERDGRLQVIGAVGYEAEVAAAYDGLPVEADSSLTEVLRTGQLVITGSPAELEQAYPDVPHSSRSVSFAGVPLEVDGRVLGVMALSAQRPGAFPDDERSFLLTLGRQCAQALERGRLFAAEQAASDRARFLARASERLSASLDYHATLDAVAALAVPAVSDWCSVHLLDDHRRPQLVGVHHKDPDRLRVLRALFDRYPPEPDRGAGVGQAVGEQRLVHHRSFPEAALRAIARDEEHLEGLRQLRLGSALVVPLQASGRTIGVLTLVRDEQDAWDDDEVRLVTDLSHRMATAVDNALRFRQERDTALTLQRSLLPRVLPELPGLRLAHRYLPGTLGSAVGGDWYDVLPLSGGLVGLVIGDVMGRGVEAAAIMGQLRAALRAYAMVELRPGQVLALLDAAVSSLEQSAITTCLYGVLDPQTRRLRLASAGHLPPLLVQPDGGGCFVELEPGPPLGVAWEPPPETEVELPEGSVLLLFTDGLVEGRQQPVEEGMVELRNAVADVDACDVDDVCDVLLQATGRAALVDDDSALLAVGIGAGRTPVPGEAVHLHLAGHLSEVARARHRAHRWARAVQPVGAGNGDSAELDAADGPADDVALLVTELASNALRHGGSGVDMWLRSGPGVLRVEVVDGRAALPRLQEPDEQAEGGRGLVLVQALASRWGSHRLSVGKCVWFEVDLPG